MSQAQQSQPERWIRAIDSARALAALGVVVCHCTQQEYGATVNGSAVGRLATWLGAWGVALFFVLSGLCIHLPHARKLAADPGAIVNWSAFYRRRARRLLPAYYAALALSAIVGAHVTTVNLGPATATSMLAHIVMAHTFNAETFSSINSVLWSIAVEVHFYLAYPLYLRMHRRLGTHATPAVLLVFGLGVYGLASVATHGGMRSVLQNLFVTRWWQWGLGVLLADVYAGGHSRLASVFSLQSAPLTWAAVSLGLAFVDCTVAGLHINGWLLPVACFMLLGALITRKGLASVALERLGAASYSMYLVHPVAIAGISVVGSVVSLSPLGRIALGIAASLAATGVFFVAVERHFIARHAPMVRASARADRQATGRISRS